MADLLRKSHTAVMERNQIWSGSFETEPYEAGWASEAIFFVRTLFPKGFKWERRRSLDMCRINVRCAF
ncbi:MAG: hypothetical protein O7G87_00315 [bacterium]|nr:hypothetical protein [bacterium]